MCGMMICPSLCHAILCCTVHAALWCESGAMMCYRLLVLVAALQGCRTRTTLPRPGHTTLPTHTSKSDFITPTPHTHKRKVPGHGSICDCCVLLNSKYRAAVSVTVVRGVVCSLCCVVLLCFVVLNFDVLSSPQQECPAPAHGCGCGAERKSGRQRLRRAAPPAVAAAASTEVQGKQRAGGRVLAQYYSPWPLVTERTQ